MPAQYRSGLPILFTRGTCHLSGVMAARQNRYCKPCAEIGDRVEWGGMRAKQRRAGRGGGLGPVVGFSSSTCQIQIPFLGLFHLHGSMWTCVNGIDPLRPLVLPHARANVTQRIPPATKSPPLDSASVTASLHRDLVRIGLLMFLGLPGHISLASTLFAHNYLNSRELCECTAFFPSDDHLKRNKVAECVGPLHCLGKRMAWHRYKKTHWLSLPSLLIQHHPLGWTQSASFWHGRKGEIGLLVPIETCCLPVFCPGS